MTSSRDAVVARRRETVIVVLADVVVSGSVFVVVVAVVDDDVDNCRDDVTPPLRHAINLGQTADVSLCQ